MEKFIGRPFNDGFYQRISPDETDRALSFLQDHFRFIAPPDDEETVERLVTCGEYLVDKFKIDGLVFDPWNEINHSFGERLSETEYISRCLKRIRRFASKCNIHVIVVAHPMKLKKDANGKYPVPTPWDISGSAHWRAKADCALCVWRDEGQPGETTVFVQKIRRRFVGKIGSVILNYDIVTGRYSDPEETRQRTYSREPGEDDE